jgi:hypothetical protein
MNETRTHPDLADWIRLLLEAVTGASCAEGWRGRVRGPMTLLLWIATPRKRKQAAAAQKAIKELGEELLVLWEAYRAGKLAAQNAPGEVPAAEEPTCDVAEIHGRAGHGDARRPRQAVETPAPRHLSGGAGTPAAEEVLPKAIDTPGIPAKPAPAAAPGAGIHRCVDSRRRPVTLPPRHRIGSARPLFSNGVARWGENCVHFVTI